MSRAIQEAITATVGKQHKWTTIIDPFKKVVTSVYCQVCGYKTNYPFGRGIQIPACEGEKHHLAGVQ